MKTLLIALATMAALAIPATAGAVDFTSNATVTNHDYGTEQVVVHSGAHVTFDNVHWGAFNATQNTYEGRLEVLPGGSVTVKNSKFGPGGCSDGIQYSSSTPSEISNTEFTGIVQGSCSPVHVDPIQFYAGDNLNFHDNYIHDSEQGIMAPDGSSGMTITNNVIDMAATHYYCMHLGTARSGTVRHNVCINGGGVRLYGGNNNVASQNMTVQDNASPVDNISCTGCTVNHNQTVTFTGGSGRCGFATASPKGTASDGTDIGLNDCGTITPPPPPPTDSDGDGVPDSTDQCSGTPAGTTVDSTGCPVVTPPPPPVDHKPVARFTFSPSSPRRGQVVTFVATSSTCEDSPCTYHWHDIASDGKGDWPLGPNGSTMTFSFQGSGAKYVEVVVTDADGDVSKVMHKVTVR